MIPHCLVHDEAATTLLSRTPESSRPESAIQPLSLAVFSSLRANLPAPSSLPAFFQVCTGAINPHPITVEAYRPAISR